MKFLKEKKGQGAIEYMFLLGVVILVVALVITYILSTTSTITPEGTKSTYDYLCGTLQSDTNQCKCYRADTGYEHDRCCTEIQLNIPQNLKTYLNCS